jgi:protein SCO1/2
MNSVGFTAGPSKAIAAGVLLIAALCLLTVSSAWAKPEFPDVVLINQDGEPVRFYEDAIKGKVVSVNFMFTSCGDACPLETAKLRTVQQMLGEHVGKDVYMYSITVDPDRDTPEALKAYMEKFDVAPGWQFLTGNKEDIDQVRDALGMLSEDEQELSDHAINFVLGNEVTGQWFRRTPFDVPEALVSLLIGRLQQHRLSSSTVALFPSYAQSKPLPPASPGEDLYNTRCTACHSIGGGDKLGPDLLGVVSKRDHQWLVRWLQEPDVMLEEKDPLAMSLYNQYGKVPMPNVQLTEKQALDLIHYMQAETRRVNAISSTQGPPSEDGLEGIVTMPPATLDDEISSGEDTPQDQARLETSPSPEVQ